MSIKKVEDCKGRLLNVEDLDLIISNNLCASLLPMDSWFDEYNYDVISNVVPFDESDIDKIECNMLEDENICGAQMMNEEGEMLELIDDAENKLLYIEHFFKFPDFVPKDAIRSKREFIEFLAWVISTDSYDPGKEILTQKDMENICKYWQDFSESTIGEYFVYKLSGDFNNTAENEEDDEKEDWDVEDE